ncbi:MAG: four helix bundle protein [Parcubacteria group bacterium]|nr:four helix bundle protein [Parcubacteria group bacterium]
MEEHPDKKSRSYEDLIVWQKSIALTKDIYTITSSFRDTERYGLISQMRRAAIFISSNIAEGQRRNTKKDFVYFLHIAYGSAAELKTEMIIAHTLDYVDSERVSHMKELIEEIERILNTFISTLKRREASH